MEKYRVGVIGGTGMVGQRFVTLLENHPWFQLTAIAASSRSAGKTYEEAIGGRWALDVPMPGEAKDMVVLNAETDIDRIAAQVDFVFSAVDMKKEEIQALEEAYARRGCPVVSNNSAHRWTCPWWCRRSIPSTSGSSKPSAGVWERSAALSPSSPTVPCKAMSPPSIPCAPSAWSRCWSAPIRPSPVRARPSKPGRRWWTT